MKAQGACIILYSVAAAKEEERLVKQLFELNYTNIKKLDDRNQLHELINEPSPSILILLMTDDNNNQSTVLDILNFARDSASKVPVVGLFSTQDSLCDQRLMGSCQEIVNWPCSNHELDFRLSQFTRECWQQKELSHRLFLNMNIIGNSPVFVQVLDKVTKVIKCDVPVFIDGETGTGKEVIARAVHYLSERKDKPFIATNCGAFPDQLMENELFGHDKGAYTDAQESSDGVIAQAEGGTLFLDEIEALSPKGQVTLLRFLETMQYRPLGSQREKIANIRIITATNESIADLVEQGVFRKDLYYRINIINVLLPPLRERSGDIGLLAEHFIRQFQNRYQQPRKNLHPGTLDALKYYDWPGNIRELENMLHREFLLADGDHIVLGQFTDMIKERRKNRDRRYIKMFDQPLVMAKNNLINEFEQQYLSSALDKANGNISEAARLAGKERRSFTRLMEKYDLDSARFKSEY